MKKVGNVVLEALWKLKALFFLLLPSIILSDIITLHTVINQKLLKAFHKYLVRPYKRNSNFHLSKQTCRQGPDPRQCHVSTRTCASTLSSLLYYPAPTWVSFGSPSESSQNIYYIHLNIHFKTIYQTNLTAEKLLLKWAGGFPLYHDQSILHKAF